MADTDKELFEQALNDTPAATPEPEPAPPEATDTPAADGQPRDPATGKFQAKAKPEPETVVDEPVAPEPPAQPERREEHRIPLSEHLSEREKRQAAERERDDVRRQVAEMERRIAELSRPKPEPVAAPDPYADPQGFVQHSVRETINPIQQQMDQMRDQFSRVMAIQQFGADVVQSARSELEREVAANPMMRFEAQRIWQSDHPYGELIEWHKRRQALAEIGTDPAAYRTKLQDELLKNPEFLARAIEAAKGQALANGAPRPPNVSLPPSLNRTPGSGAAPQGAVAQTDAEIFKEMFPR